MTNPNIHLERIDSIAKAAEPVVQIIHEPASPVGKVIAGAFACGAGIMTAYATFLTFGEMKKREGMAEALREKHKVEGMTR